MGDLASGTSSWSTKLIHGGLRYLEHYEFRLVREALIEREILWGIAPHIIRPLRLVLPHRRGLRPAWLLRLGLLLYDHLGGRKRLEGTRTVALDRDPVGRALKSGPFIRGFEYSDCVVDDARLVVLNAMDARAHGAAIETRTRTTRATRVNDHWQLTLDRHGGNAKTIRARALINAAGPWVADLLGTTIGLSARAKVRLVQGSHIVVRKLFDHDRGYMLQNPDGRIVFALPYLGEFTLIGTTDRDYRGDPAAVKASAEEITYLCDAISADFARPVRPEDVVWSFSGVRPLYDDGASEAKAATRDYVFELENGEARAPLLSIFGGKITTYRRLAEEALVRLAPHLPENARRSIESKAGWTRTKPLPGGDFEVGAIDALEVTLHRTYPFLTADHARRLTSAYGTRASRVLGTARKFTDLGHRFGADLTEAEVRYLMAEEWASTADDIVWRRSKLGLRMSAGEIAALDEWLKSAACGATASGHERAP
jgi:glycerol-3-phosphate dehydrogenase